MPKGIVKLDIDPNFADKSFAQIWGVEDAAKEGDAGDAEKRAKPAPGTKLEAESEGFMVRYLVEAVNLPDMWALVENIHDATIYETNVPESDKRPSGLGIPGGEVSGTETAIEALTGQEIGEIPKSWTLVGKPVPLFMYERPKKNWRVWNTEHRLAIFLEKTSCFFVRVDTRPSDNDESIAIPESVRHVEKQEIGDAIFFQTDHIVRMSEEAEWLKELERLLRRNSGRGFSFNPKWLEDVETLLKKSRSQGLQFFDYRLVEWAERFEAYLKKRWYEQQWKYRRVREIDTKWGKKEILFHDPRPKGRSFYCSHGPLFAEMLQKVEELKASGAIQ